MVVKATDLRIAVKCGKTDIQAGNLPSEIIVTGPKTTIERDRVVDRENRFTAKARRPPAVLETNKCTVGIRELVIHVAVHTRHDDHGATGFRVFVRHSKACSRHRRCERRRLDPFGKDGPSYGKCHAHKTTKNLIEPNCHVRNLRPLAPARAHTDLYTLNLRRIRPKHSNVNRVFLDKIS